MCYKMIQILKTKFIRFNKLKRSRFAANGLDRAIKGKQNNGFKITGKK